MSHVPYRAALVRVNRILRGWADYFRHAVAKHTLARLTTFVWWRVVHWLMHRKRMTWSDVQRRFRHSDGWRPITLDGIALFSLATVPVTRYRYWGNAIPLPWPEALPSPPQTA